MNTLESCTTTNPFDQIDECAKFIIDDPMSSFTLHDITEVGKEYTLAFWVKADDASKLLVASNSIPVTTEWLRHIIVFTAKEKDLEILFRSNGNYYMYHSKLEKGNKATEWELSIDDLSYEIDESIAILHETTIEENTAILETSRDIVLQALGSYVQRDNGTFVTDISNYYLASSLTSDVTTNDEGWSENIPAYSAETPNLWTYEIITYSDESKTELLPRLISTYESSAISSIVEYYGVNSDSESPMRVVNTYDDDTGEIIESQETDLEWVTAIPVLSVTDFCLWKKEQITYEDGTLIVTDPHYIGRYRRSFYEVEKELQAQLSIMNDKIEMNFESASKKVEDLEDEVKETITDIKKYIEFSENGIIIRSGSNSLELQLDNEAGIIFSKDGTAFGTWDGTDFHTGNIIIDVEKRAQFGNYAFIPRSDNSLMFLKVGD